MPATPPAYERVAHATGDGGDQLLHTQSDRDALYDRERRRRTWLSVHQAVVVPLYVIVVPDAAIEVQDDIDDLLRPFVAAAQRHCILSKRGLIDSLRAVDVRRDRIEVPDRTCFSSKPSGFGSDGRSSRERHIPGCWSKILAPFATSRQSCVSKVPQTQHYAPRSKGSDEGPFHLRTEQ